MAESIRLRKVQKQNGKSLPLYRQIAEELRLRIESDMAPNDRLPAISELVRQCNVDYKTVMLALQMLEKEGLIRLEQGRGKGPIVIGRPARKFSIMFVRWDRDPMSLEMTDGIRRFTSERGFECLIFDASRSHEHVINAITHPMRNVDGMLVFPQDKPEYIKAIHSALEVGIKIVFLDRVLDGIPVSSVSIDHVNGAYKATMHLLSQHHLPVYYIGSTNDPSSVRDRLHGWTAAMQQYNFNDLDRYIRGLPKPEYELTLSPEESWKLNHEVAKTLLLQEKAQKLSIFTVNDNVARSVYSAADELGLVVGTDVFIASFGDMPFCKKLPVPLTSVHQCDEQVGYEACNALYRELVGTVRQPAHRVLPAELHIRPSSTGIVAKTDHNREPVAKERVVRQGVSLHSAESMIQV